MLEYARWKYILVGVVLLLALILALPNVFGEAPALQFVRKDRAEITTAAQADVEKFLTDQKAKNPVGAIANCASAPLSPRPVFAFDGGT